MFFLLYISAPQSLISLSSCYEFVNIGPSHKLKQVITTGKTFVVFICSKQLKEQSTLLNKTL